MKKIILCGGYGTRLSEETKIKPKPMVKIGKYPIVEHIMHSYKNFGFNDFILALGYKGYFIKRYFKKKKISRVSLIDTGVKTLTGGRLLRLKKYFKKNENFLLTYGDGLTNQNFPHVANFQTQFAKAAIQHQSPQTKRYHGCALWKWWPV